MFVSFVGNHLPSNASHPRRLKSSLKQNKSSVNIFTQTYDENFFLIHDLKNWGGVGGGHREKHSVSLFS